MLEWYILERSNTNELALGFLEANHLGLRS